MSVENVRAAIERFLADKKPQVLCIRGAWGSGKTYTWDTVLREASCNNKVHEKNYAKASLFGVNSIKELKREIFQSTIEITEIGKPFNIENVRSVVKNITSFSRWAINKASFVHEDAVTAAIEVSVLFAREQIILIDDLERKGADLRSADVLGYISQLRDDRACKVVLILNDQELEDEPEFSTYLEKVVDINLRFQPTPTEITKIAVPGEDNISAMVRNNASNLGIDNVRVIRKILHIVREVEPFLSKYSETVMINATAVISILGWSYFQPNKAPPLDYLKRVNTYAPSKDDERYDLKWRDILLSYNYKTFGDFDLVLLRGIQNGYFDRSEIEKHAEELQNADEKRLVDEEMRAIWDDMHYSFQKPAGALLDRFFECYSRNIAFMKLGDMSILERLFRELGDARSEQVVERYIAFNKGRPDAFDFDRLTNFGNELTGSVRSKIAAAEAAQAPKLNADEIFLALGTHGYEEEIYHSAARLPVEEYIRVLKTYEKRQLSDIISGLRQYLNVANPNPRMLTIMDKAGEALRQIATESPINKRRAMRLGLIQRLDAIEAEKEAEAAQEISADVGRMQQGE